LEAPSGNYRVIASALKHGFSEAEILNALAMPFAEVQYKAGRDIRAFCGPDNNGNPMELLVDYSQEPPVVFHADRLTVSFEKLIRAQANRNARNR
jgi:hypothetical protein